MATEKLISTIDLKIGTYDQLNANIDSYEEGTLFGITDPISLGDLNTDLIDKVSNNAKVNAANTFTESQTFNKDITIKGNIIQNGSNYETHAEDFYTKNDLIHTRDGATVSLGDTEFTGIQATKYDGTNDGQLVFDKNGIARVGDVGDTQPLATRSESTDIVDGRLMQWSSTTEKLVDSGKKTSDFLQLIEPTGIQTEFVIITKDSTGYRQSNITGIATVSDANKAAYKPVLRGGLGQLTCCTPPVVSQTDYDCINRKEFNTRKYYRHHLTLTISDTQIVYYDTISTVSTAYTLETLPVSYNDHMESFILFVNGGGYSNMSGVVYRDGTNAAKILLHGVYTPDGTTISYFTLPGTNIASVSDDVEEIALS